MVRNKAGTAVSVVHQYDRYPDLQKHLFHKVCAFTLTSSPCSSLTRPLSFHLADAVRGLGEDW